MRWPSPSRVSISEPRAALAVAVEGEQLQRHLHVLQGGERLEQVVGLEDKAQLASQVDQSAGRGPVQFASQHLQAALLHGAQRADERQQRGFARAGGAGHDDDFAAGHVEVVVEEHLLLQVALAEIVLQVVDPHGVAVVVIVVARRTGGGGGDCGCTVGHDSQFRSSSDTPMLI